jgi:hypothetical protein
MAFFKSYRHVTAAQDSFFSLDTPLFDILYISVTSFSLFMVGFYWILLRPTNLRMIGQWAPHQFQTLVGYHLGLFMTIPEIFLTCHPIIKIQAIFPPFAAVAYIFLVWITHYFGNWPWPLPIFPEYFEKELHFMFLAASFAVLLLSMTFACTVVYSLVQLRELISEKRLGVKEVQ